MGDEGSLGSFFIKRGDSAKEHVAFGTVKILFATSLYVRLLMFYLFSGSNIRTDSSPCLSIRG